MAAKKRSAQTVAKPARPATVEAYLAGCRPEIRPQLERIRRTILRAAPGARERISYQMPAYALEGGGILAYFGAFRSHVGFYPPVRDPVLKKAAARYAGPKGNLRFPLDEAIPHALIAKIVRSRVRALAAKASSPARASRKPAAGRRAVGR
jgi:uncharacterized protein YdhG (YjbR/CyaY superfamily)